MSDKTTGNALAGRVAVVTGGTRGIGFAIAERLLADGAQVAICGTSQKSVDDAVSALGRGAVGFMADIAKPGDVKRFITAVHERFGAIHILINNAGLATFRSAASLSPDEWDRMIGVNLSGAYYCCHEVLPIFIAEGGGDVINISSLAGKNAFAGGTGYNASKFGLNGFSEAMMLDHRNDGVRICTIMPGSVDTAFSSAPDAGTTWKIAPADVAEIVTLLTMPRRTTVSSVEIRPSRPAPAKQKPAQKQEKNQ